MISPLLQSICRTRLRSRWDLPVPARLLVKGLLQSQKQRYCGNISKNVGTSGSDKGRICLYESAENLTEVAKDSFKRCQLGASLGVLGFASVMVATSAKASLPILAFMGCGAILNTYMVLELPRRSMRSLALKHVERLYLCPSPLIADQIKSGKSADDCLAAASVLEIEVHSPNVIRRVRLEDAVAAWQGARYGGLAADSRPTFADACQQLLHIDVEDGKCHHPNLVNALINSGKVITSEQVEIRSDAESCLRIPESGNLPDGAALASAQASQGDRETLKQLAFIKSTPTSSIQGLGTRSIYAGLALVFVGSVGLVKSQFASKDEEDGATRLK